MGIIATKGKRMRDLLHRLVKCRRGATAIEYAFLCALIFLAVMVSISLVGSRTLGMWTNISNSVPVIQN